MGSGLFGDVGLVSEEVVSAKSGKELLEKLKRMRETGDPWYDALVAKMEVNNKPTKRSGPRKRRRIEQVHLSFADELYEPGEPTYTHGESRTENLDYYLEVVDCPTCGKRGGLRAHFGKYVDQTLWYGPYFGIVHPNEDIKFCYFGKSYPDMIHTRVPDPNVK